MKIFLTISIILCCDLIYGQHKFPDLEYIQIESSNLGGSFGYNDSQKFQLTNKSCDDLNSCFEYEDPLVFIGKSILNEGQELEFYYTEAPSDDPTFIIVYGGEIVLEECGTTLHLKGSTIYLEGIENSYFDKKRKFTFNGNVFKEVPQPFYHIGVTGKLNYSIKLYESQDFTNQIASLPKDYEIEIVLGITGGEYNELERILIRSEFGLIGWVNFQEISMGYPIIDGFYFHGD